MLEYTYPTCTKLATKVYLFVCQLKKEQLQGVSQDVSERQAEACGSAGA